MEIHWISIIQLFVWCAAYSAISLAKANQNSHEAETYMKRTEGAWATLTFYTLVQIAAWLLQHIKWV